MKNYPPNFLCRNSRNICKDLYSIHVIPCFSLTSKQMLGSLLSFAVGVSEKHGIKAEIFTCRNFFLTLWKIKGLIMD